jgi:uncharacterized membrane protein
MQKNKNKNKTMTLSAFAIVDMCIGFAILLCYHVVYMLMQWRVPHKMALGVNIMERQRWVHKFFVANYNKEILGIQTCRNGTMASSFLASSALLVAFGIASVVLEDVQDAGDSSQLSFFDWKVLVCAAMFFVSFLAFALAVRAFNHLSFLVGVPYDKSDDDDDGGNGNDDDDDVAVVGDDEQERRQSHHHRHEQVPEESIDVLSMKRVLKPSLRVKSHRRIHVSASRTITNATVTFSVGMRFLYLAIPAVLWLLGPPGLTVGSVLLVFLLYFQDFMRT